jgi:hypothetical protein
MCNLGVSYLEGIVDLASKEVSHLLVQELRRRCAVRGG